MVWVALLVFLSSRFNYNGQEYLFFLWYILQPISLGLPSISGILIQNNAFGHLHEETTDYCWLQAFWVVSALSTFGYESIST
ncbi:MAG: hypothetical protein IPP49_07010 [Saprospiraceae bacterium]|nr:hypothetical protein [Saprospiraceae bacterium]